MIKDMKSTEKKTTRKGKRQKPRSRQKPNMQLELLSSSDPRPRKRRNQRVSDFIVCPGEKRAETKLPSCG